MLTAAERERLEEIERMILSLTGQTITLVSQVEAWLASDSPALQALGCYIARGREAALTLLNAQIAGGGEERQSEVMTALLRTMRGVLYEHNQEPEQAFADYTAALRDIPEGEARTAVLDARRRVAYVAN